MTDTKRAWRYGFITGLCAAILDVSLILAVDASATWAAFEAMLFWTVTGWIVAISDTRLGPYAHGIVVTFLLNLPWYVSLGPASGQLGHVPPLMLMSVLFGLGFGWARLRLGTTR